MGIWAQNELLIGDNNQQKNTEIENLLTIFSNSTIANHLQCHTVLYKLQCLIKTVYREKKMK